MRVMFTDHHELNGLKELVDYIKELYGRPVSNVRFKDDREVQEIVTCLDTPQGSLERLILGPDLDLVWTVTRGLPYLKYLEFHDIYYKEVDGNDARIWEFEEMKVNSGMNINLTRLLNMKCAYLTIEYSVFFSTEDFNGYLKKWASGNVPWIKHLTMEVFSLRELQFFDGIKYCRNDGRVLEIGTHNHTNRRGRLLKAYDVQSDSGIRATCFASGVEEHDYHKTIDFVVWE